MLSKISQMEKDKYKTKQMNKHRRNSVTDTEKQQVLSEGRGMGGRKK